MNEKNEIFGWLPCSVVFISAAHGGKRDIMTATAMFVSEKDPLLAISMAKDHLAGKLVQEAGEFILGITSEKQKDLVWQLGGGKDADDKFKIFSENAHTCKEGKPVIPAGAAAWLDCKVVGHHDIEGYSVVMARVVDQGNLGNPPLIWKGDSLFSIKPL